MKERPAVTVEIVSALSAAVDERYQAMVLLAAWVGLRFGELAGLQVREIDLGRQTVRVCRQAQERSSGEITFGPPKTDAGFRTVAIPPHIAPQIAAHLDRRRAMYDTPTSFSRRQMVGYFGGATSVGECGSQPAVS